MADYNGWTNYETWAVNLWMDNDAGGQAYWREQAEDVWRIALSYPPENQVLSASEYARARLADRLKEEHDDNMLPTIADAIANTVYADLLGAALGNVDWYEIADNWLENAELDGYVPRERVRA